MLSDGQAEGLLSSASRCSFAGRPSKFGTEVPTLSVSLEDLLPQARRQRRKHLLASEQVTEEEREQWQEAVEFWSSSRLTRHQVAPPTSEEPPEVFISHHWHSEDSEHKVFALKSWAAACKALMDENRCVRAPWFLIDDEQEQQEALVNPKNSWRQIRCWMDKACGHRGFGSGAPPQECLRATKAALAECQTFAAVVSDLGYFRSLWCSFEWVYFLSRAAPNYRDLEIVLPNALQEPAEWSELLEEVASFRLQGLRCGGEASELWRELRHLAVDDEALESFVRATGLALLALQAMLRQSGCAAFSGAVVDPVVEAARSCGLRGLSKILGTAQPTVWWRDAYRQVRHQHEERCNSGTVLEEGGREAVQAGGDQSDPLELLMHFVQKKFFDVPAEAEGAASEAVEDVKAEKEVEEEVEEMGDEIAEPGEAQKEEAQELKADGDEEEGLEAEVADPDTADANALDAGEESQAAQEESFADGMRSQRKVNPCSSKDAGTYAIRFCEANALRMARAAKLQMDFMHDMESFQKSFKRSQKEKLESIPEVKDEPGAGEQEEAEVDGARGEAESTAWKAVLARAGAGIPEGYLEFWEGAQGHTLQPEAKVHARIYLRSWAIYHRRVCKWFDTHVVPFLEVWRHRALRSRGVIEEAFGEAFLHVGGSVEEHLASQFEKTPEMWANPCLERMLVIGGKTANIPGSEDRSRQPAVLLSPLPLRLGEVPQSAVVCARVKEGAWRRACVAQGLGATGLRHAVYHLLTNFSTEGCTSAGVELEVILPRLLLQVRGSASEAVCGLRIRGSLEEKVETPELSRLSETPQQEETVSTSSEETQEEDGGRNWSPWIHRTPPEEGIKGGTRPRSLCKAKIGLQLLEGDAMGFRRWWPEPTGAAERLLPPEVAGLPRKLPLIGEQRTWRPAADPERGLHRAWKSPRPVPRKPEMPKAELVIEPFLSKFPKSARAKMLKSEDCYKLKDSQWLWRCLLDGGPKPCNQPAHMEERYGSLQHHFERLYRQLARTCFAQWVDVGTAALEQERPLRSGCYTGGGGGLLPWRPEVEEARPGGQGGSVAPEPLNASEPCPKCSQRCLSKINLQGSMMSSVWQSPVCVVCLRCGFFTAEEMRAELLQEEAILEVATSVLVRPGDAETLQRCLARVLRVESNCCCVAMCHAESRAASRVAAVSFALGEVTTAAAAAVVTRPGVDVKEQRFRPFANDQNWVVSGLADTGLDLYYDVMRNYSVELAIQELDDKRMLRLRQEVSPLVLWLELAYLLSEDFSLIKWSRALSEVFGAVGLTAAVIMRMNINRLRQVAGAGPIPLEEMEDAPVVRRGWPLALHRVIAVKASAREETLAAAMEGAGLMPGGFEALKRLGEERQNEHFSGVDDQFQEELAAGKQDVQRTSVATAMAVLAKTRTMFGTSSRALLQARRILKRKQVFLFLRDLYTNIVADDRNLPSWLYDEVPEHVSEDGSSSSDAEDLVLDEDDEDLMIHAPRDVQDRMEERHKPQGLTIVKVLGHFAEYVHFSQMALMCIQVLGVMVRTALRVKTNAHGITSRTGEKQVSGKVEQAMISGNFVASALRCLYRHYGDTGICRETLMLLTYLANEEADHEEHAKAKAQMLEPFERPFTLLLTISKLSSLDDRGNLLLALQVYMSLATYAKSSEARQIQLDPTREAEAAQMLVGVLESQWRDQAVFKLTLQILFISCEKEPFCRCFFEARLSSALRRFLRKARRGEVKDGWFEEVKARTGLSAKSFRRAKEAVLAQKRVADALADAEVSCWQLLETLAMNAGGGALQLEAHEDYLLDTSKSIAQALDEMQQKSSQWPLAVKFLEAMLLYDYPGHGEFFQEKEGLSLTLKELPYGQVKEVYPLLVAILRLHRRSIPEAPRYCVVDDPEELVRKFDSFPRNEDRSGKPLIFRSKRAARNSMVELPQGELVLESDKLVMAAKAMFAEEGAAKVLLESLLEADEEEIQDGLLRILSELLQDPKLGAGQAAEEFRDFDDGSAVLVFDLMHGALKNQRRIASALYCLTGAVEQLPDTAASLATEPGAKLLIRTVWKYWMLPDMRRRGLMLLRRARDSTPDLTSFMLQHWKAHLAAFERGELQESDVEAQDEVTVPEAPEGGPGEEVGAPPESTERSAKLEEDIPVWGKELWAEDDLRPGSSLEPAPREVYLAKEALPREMRHFLALLKVHRFEQKSSILGIPDVVQAIMDFSDDPDLARNGVRVLMSGTAMEQEGRLPTISRCFSFVKTIRRLVHREGSFEMLQLYLRLVLGILEQNPGDYQDWVEVDVLTVAKVLQASHLWTSSSWEVMLHGIEEALRTPQGKLLLQNFNVALALYQEWEALKDSRDDALAKILVSSFLEQTDRIMDLLS